MSISDAITSIGTLVTIAVVVVGALLYIIYRKPGQASTKVLIIISTITSAIIVSIVVIAVFISASTTITVNGHKTLSIPGFPAATETPAATAPPTATPIPVPTPKVIPEDLNIDCLNCGGNYALTVKLNTFTIDYSHQQTTMKFTITNSGSTSCDVQILKLEFQDVNGTISKAQNVDQYIGDIAVGNPFIVNSIFDLLPRPNIHYLLNTSLRCANELDYKTQDFVFT